MGCIRGRAHRWAGAGGRRRAGWARTWPSATRCSTRPWTHSGRPSCRRSHLTQRDEGRSGPNRRRIWPPKCRFGVWGCRRPLNVTEADPCQPCLERRLLMAEGAAHRPEGRTLRAGPRREPSAVRGITPGFLQGLSRGPTRGPGAGTATGWCRGGWSGCPCAADSSQARLEAKLSAPPAVFCPVAGATGPAQGGGAARGHQHRLVLCPCLAVRRGTVVRGRPRTVDLGEVNECR